MKKSHRLFFFHLVFLHWTYNCFVFTKYTGYGINKPGWGRSWIHVIITKFSAPQCHLNVFLVCRGQLAGTCHKSPRESKNVHISWPHLDDQVEAFQVGSIPGILNFEVTLSLIHTYSTFKHVFSNSYLDSPWFPLSETHPD